MRDVSTEQLLTRQQVCERLQCGETLLASMVRAGMPTVRWGSRYVRFRWTDVVRWLQDERRAA